MDEDWVGISWRDATTGMMLMLVILLVVVLQHVNDPGQEESEAKPVGNVVVSTSWAAGDSDIDTWVFGPDEANPVGYSNRNGKVFALLKDDLGNPDADLNYESVISRGVPAGRYWINLHTYRIAESLLPVTVTVSVEVHTGQSGKGMKKVATTSVVLGKQGEERTAFSFELTEQGALVAKSLNNVFRPLRASSGFDNPDYGN